MDGIISILIIAAVVIFKLVGKNISSGSGDEVFPTIPVDPEEEPIFIEQDEPAPVRKAEPEVRPEPVVEEGRRTLPSQDVRKPKAKKTVQPVAPKVYEPILVEEESKPKEKIDLKKLVVYSEIMKPKHSDEY